MHEKSGKVEHVTMELKEAGLILKYITDTSVLVIKDKIEGRGEQVKPSHILSQPTIEEHFGV